MPSKSPTRPAADTDVQEQPTKPVPKGKPVAVKRPAPGVGKPARPEPAQGRPGELAQEEARRAEIVREERLIRSDELRRAAPEEREFLKEQWAKDDLLWFMPGPDHVELEVYTVRKPWQYVQVLKHTVTKERIYFAVEPRLKRRELELLDFIRETMIDVLEVPPGDLRRDQMQKYIREQVATIVSDYGINLKRIARGDPKGLEARLNYYLERDFIGEGPLDILMNDPSIEDISCDGPHEPIFVYHRGHEALTTTIRFRTEEELDSFVIRLAQRAGKHVSIAEPILDATMRDGSRLQATLSREVSSFGSTFTIRKFKETPFTPLDLVRFGTMDAGMIAYLWMIIEHHMSAIYAGGTASGKTTGLNALMMFIPPQNKVVTIEDTREIRVPQPNWIAGITRDGFGPVNASGRQAGEIDMFQLLKNALRQRPEYIVVGEVRGAEAYSLFQAMATGHAAFGTMHADSVDAVIHRLESEPISIPRTLLEALDVVAVQIQTRVGNNRVRRTKQITEIVGIDQHTREILTNEVFTWDPNKDVFRFSGVSYAFERIARETGSTPDGVKAEWRRRTGLLEAMMPKKMSYDEIAQVIYDDYVSGARKT